jgi:NTP pyrophosphatase (non-canonical NTP hydrolase)
MSTQETDINKLVQKATENANKHGWKVYWHLMIDEEDVDTNTRYLSTPEALCLCHSELSEALEEYRNENKEKFATEIADEFIRLLHLCGDLNINIASFINAKMSINEKRPINHGRKNL